MQGAWVWSLVRKLAEKAMAPLSSTLAWKIPQMEEPGGLQSTGSLRVWHDWVTSLSRIGEGNGNPLQCSCLVNPRDGGAWWAALYGVAQSRTRLKRLSSSSRELDPAFMLQLRVWMPQWRSSESQLRPSAAKIDLKERETKEGTDFF